MEHHPGNYTVDLREEMDMITDEEENVVKECGKEIEGAFSLDITIILGLVILTVDQVVMIEDMEMIQTEEKGADRLNQERTQNETSASNQPQEAVIVSVDRTGELGQPAIKCRGANCIISKLTS